MIGSCQHSFVGNLYGYDDDEIDALLVGIHQDPNRYFQLNLDKSQAGGVHERVLLEKWKPEVGSSIAIGTSAKHAISHLKVAIIDGLYVLSGSTNWSISGETKQDNQATITNDPVLAVEVRKILDINHAVMLAQGSN